MNYKRPEGARLLLSTLSGELPHPHTLTYDPDAEVSSELRRLEYVQPAVFDLVDFTNQHRLRSRIRYLAALWYDNDLQQLTHRIHGLVNNKELTVDDIRAILQGRRLNDTSRITNEVPLSIIQGIGRCLSSGMSLRSTARDMRVSYDTVESIEKYLGIKRAYDDKLMDEAVQGARHKESTRGLAKRLNISKSKAHRLLLEAHSVLRELGEIND